MAETSISIIDTILKRARDRVLGNEVISLAGTTTEYHESDLKHMLHLIEDLMQQTTFAFTEIPSDIAYYPKTRQEENNESKIGFTGVMVPYISTITNLSRELKCKAGENEDEKTVKIIKALSIYSWKAIVVLALSAFCIKYGKIRLISIRFEERSLATAVALLKQQEGHGLNEDYTSNKHLRTWFQSLAILIAKMLKLTNHIVYLEENYHDKAMAEIFIPRAVYWIIHSVVVCSSQIIDVLVMHNRSYAPYEWHLDYLAKILESTFEGHSYQEQPPQSAPQKELHEKHPKTQQKVVERGNFNLMQKFCLRGTPDNSVHSDRLPNQINVMAYQRLHSKPHHQNLLSSDEIMYAESYEPLQTLSDSNLSNNIDILKALVDQEHDQPLLDGSTKDRVSMDALKSKMVLLLISDLDLSHEEITRLNKVLLESRTHPKCLKNQYETVWIPIVNSSMSWNEKRHHFETIQSWIPWYSIYYPTLINPTAINYIKEVWKFNGKPLVLVLDYDQGKVVNYNAIHMIRIWGNLAFPFTQMREEILWKTHDPFGIDFLVDSIDPMLTNLIGEFKYICLFGGDEDMEWIQRFTSTAREFASISNLPMELIYMGRSTIVSEGNNTLCHLIQDTNLINFFWLRLESILNSRSSVSIQSENDPLTQGLKKVINFDKEGKKWAIIGRKESKIMCLGSGENVLKSFMEYNNWKNNGDEDLGFLQALCNYLHELEKPQSGSNLQEKPHENSLKKHNKRSNSTSFLLRSLSCFVDSPTK